MRSAISFRDAAVTGTATLCRTGSVELSDFQLQNTNASIVYLQLFDAAAVTDVTLGTTAPTRSFKIEASVAPFIGLPRSIRFGKGLVYAVTTGEANNTAPGSACILTASIA